MTETDLLKTPLAALHYDAGAKMVPFAGFSMPVQYGPGVMQEHLHTRAAAGLFDVSHMGQLRIVPKSGRLADAAHALEGLMPVDVLGLPEGRQRYGFFTNDRGGILDDLMFANCGDHFFMVVNAANMKADLDHLNRHLGSVCEIQHLSDRALLAVQGPAAGDILGSLWPETVGMSFMDVIECPLDTAVCVISRSGYSGEDGFEISVPEPLASQLATELLADERVALIGLGARDSLRLEAGLCLHGSDIDPETTPVEAGLTWAIQKVRRPGGERAGGYPGRAVIEAQLASGPLRRRVGLVPDGRAPMRAGVELFATEEDAEPIGVVTSGGYSPSLNHPVSMGYVTAASSEPGTSVFAEIRGKRLPAQVRGLPFVSPNYKR